MSYNYLLYSGIYNNDLYHYLQNLISQERNGNVPRLTSPEELTFLWSWVGLAFALGDICDDRVSMGEDWLLVCQQCYSQCRAELCVLRVCHLQQSCSKVTTAAPAEECFCKLACSNFWPLVASGNHPAPIEAEHKLGVLAALPHISPVNKLN